MDENICIADAYIEGDKLYAAGLEENLFFQYDMKNLRLDPLGCLEVVELSNGFWCNAIFKYEDSLFCFLWNSYKVTEFDMKHMCFEYHYPKDGVNKIVGKIRSICRVGDEIWMFRKVTDPFVVVFSMKERAYHHFEINIKGTPNAYFPLAFETCICAGSQIWRCIPGSSDLISFDVKEKKGYIIKTDLKMQFGTINYDDGFLWILTMDGRNIISFNIDEHKAVVYETGYDQMLKWPFYRIIKSGELLFMLPGCEKEIYYFKIIKKELCLIKKIKLPEKFKKIHGKECRSTFFGYKKMQNKLYLFPFTGNGVLELDLQSFAFSYYPLKISKQNYLRFFSVKSEKNVNLEEYIQFIANDQKELIVKKNELTMGGNYIWKNISF